jgi:myo-inositol 2-dehydrogenase / D-chiro-inositol 1-dehydrogenase
VATAEGYTRPPLHDFFMTRYTGAYANEIAGFIAAIETGALISPSGEDGLLALQLADAALESVRTGRRVTLA